MAVRLLGLLIKQIQLQTNYISRNARHKKRAANVQPFDFIGGVLGIRTLDLWINSPDKTPFISVD